MSASTYPNLSTSDLAWLRVQTAANSALAITTLAVDGQLDASCVRSRVEDRIMIHARFRQQVEVPHLPLARPRWRDCDEFHLADHFVEIDLAESGVPDTLEGFLDELRSTALDDSRPLWQVHLVRLSADSSALIVRVHAALADCTALPDLVLALTDDPATVAAPPVLELESLGSPERILERASRAANATRTLCSLITERADRDTPLRGPIGGHKMTAWSDPVPRAALLQRAVELDVGAMELVLAAVTSGLRRALHRHDFPAEGVELQAVMPWSLRRPTDSPTGSKLALARIGLPVGEPSAADRLAAVRREIERLSLDPESVVVIGADPSHALSMTEIEERSVRLLGQKTTIALGAFAAPAESVRICNQRVRELYWSPIATGDTAVAIGMVDYAGALRFEVVCDRSLTLDAERIAADLATATSEM